VIEQEPDTECIEGFRGPIASALCPLLAEAAVVDPASEAFLALSTALAQWQAREDEAATA
jgi:hypothetical protein